MMITELCVTIRLLPSRTKKKKIMEEKEGQGEGKRFENGLTTTDFPKEQVYMVHVFYR